MGERVIDLSDLGADLEAVGSVLDAGSFAEELRGPVRGVVYAGIGENFASSRSADGQAWPARQVLGDGHPLLIQSGQLLEAATGQGAGSIVEVSDRELVVGVELVHAPTHQFGRAKANIPARPYLGVSEDKLDTIGDMLSEHGEKLLDER